MRDLTLVESLLQVVEKLESHEEDPEQLELLFRIDHLATRMRRNSENLLVLAGHDTEGRDFEPVPLLDVGGAAISEITDYSRAQVTSCRMSGHRAGRRRPQPHPGRTARQHHVEVPAERGGRGPR